MGWNGPAQGICRVLTQMLIALVAMFLQQTFVSAGRVLPAVTAPLIIASPRAGPAWVGVCHGVAAASPLVARMGVRQSHRPSWRPAHEPMRLAFLDAGCSYHPIEEALLTDHVKEVAVVNPSRIP